MQPFQLGARFTVQQDDISVALTHILQAYNQATGAANTMGQAASAAGAQAAAGAQRQAGAAAQAAQATQQQGQAAHQAASSVGALGTASQTSAVNINNLTVNLRQNQQATHQTHQAWISFGSILSSLPGPLGQAASAFGHLSFAINQTQAVQLGVAAGFTAMGASIAAGVGSLAKEAANYESAMAQVQIVTQGTQEDMARISASAMDLGARTAFNSKHVAAGFYELASAGLTVNESLTAIESVTKVAMLAGRDLGATTKDTVNVMRQWGLEAKDITHIVDVQAMAVQGSTLHWHEVGDVYRNIAGRAHTMGSSLEETTSALMLTVNAGLTASMAGTALGTFFDRLSKQTGEARRGAELLGLQLYDTQGRFVGLTNVLEQIEQRIPHWTQQQINQAESLLSGARASGFLRNALTQQQRVMIDGEERLLKGTELMKHWTEELTKANGVVDKQANVVFGTWNLQLKMLEGTLGEAAIRIGQEFLPALEEITPAAQSVVRAFVMAPGPVHAATAAFLASAAASTTLVGTFTTLRLAAVAMSAMLAPIGLTLSAMLVPIALLTVAGTALAVAWATDFGNIRTNAEQTAAAIESSQKDIAGHVLTPSDHLELMRDRWNKYWASVRGGVSEAQEGVSEATGIPIDKLNPASIPGPVGRAVGIVGMAAEWYGPAVERFQKGMVEQARRDAEELAEIRGETFLAGSNAFIRMVAEEGQRASRAYNEGFTENPLISEGWRDQQSAIFDQLHADLTTKGRDLGAEVIAAFEGGLTKPQLREYQGWFEGLAQQHAVSYGHALRTALSEAVSGAIDVESAFAEGGSMAALRAAGEQMAQELIDGLEARFGKLDPIVVGQIRALFEGRVQELMNKAGAGAAEEFATSFEAQLEAAMGRLLKEAGGNLAKATTDAIGQGNEAAAAEFIKQANQQKIIQGAITGTTAAFQAQVQVMMAAEGTLKTIWFLYDTGIISAGTLRNGLEGTGVAAEKAGAQLRSFAVDQKEFAEAIKSGNQEAAVEMLRLDVAAKTVAQTIGGLDPVYRVQIQMLQETQGPFAAVIQLYEDGHLTAEQLNMTLRGLVPTQEKVLTGAQAHAKAERERKAAMQEALQSTDAAIVQTALLAQSYETVASNAIKGMSAQLQASTLAAKNQGDVMAVTRNIMEAYGVEASVVAGALAGERTQEQLLEQAIRSRAKAVEEAMRAGRASPADNVLRGGRSFDWTGPVHERDFTPEQRVLRDLQLGGLIDPLRSIPTQVAAAQEAGRSLAQGMAAGIVSGGDELRQAAQEMATSAVDAMRAAIEAESPSKKAAREVGAPLAQGVGVGFSSVWKEAADQINREITSSMGAMATDAIKVWMNIQRGPQAPTSRGGSAAQLAAQDAPAVEAMVAELEKGMTEAGRRAAGRIAVYGTALGGRLGDALMTAWGPLVEGMVQSSAGAVSLAWVEQANRLGWTPLTAEEEARNREDARRRGVLPPAGEDPRVPPPGIFYSGYGDIMTTLGGEYGGVGGRGATINIPTSGGTGTPATPGTTTTVPIGGLGETRAGTSGGVSTIVPLGGLEETRTGTGVQSTYLSEVLMLSELGPTMEQAQAQGRMLLDGISHAAAAWGDLGRQSADWAIASSVYTAAFPDHLARIDNALGSIAGSYMHIASGAAGGIAAGPQQVVSRTGGPGGAGPLAFTQDQQIAEARRQAIIAEIVAINGGLAPANLYNGILQDKLRGDQEYIRIMGPVRESTVELERQHAVLTQEESQLAAQVRQMGDGMAASQGVMTLWLDAQARLAAVTDSLAAAASAAATAPPSTAPVDDLSWMNPIDAQRERDRRAGRIPATTTPTSGSGGVMGRGGDPTHLTAGLPGFANEGLIYGPMTAKLAERGPEVVENLDRRIMRIVEAMGRGNGSAAQHTLIIQMPEYRPINGYTNATERQLASMSLVNEVLNELAHRGIKP